METDHFNSTKPYSFTFSYPESFVNIIDDFNNGPYWFGFYGKFLLPRLIFQTLKKVKLISMSEIDLRKRLANINVTKWADKHVLHSYGVFHGITDSTPRFYYLNDESPTIFHVSPATYIDSFVILSSVKTGQRDYSEVQSIQGLGDLDWVLVALSLLAVSAVSSCISFRKRKRRESRFFSFAKSLWTHTADILNNTVADAKKEAAPLRQVRAWWLLGVTVIIYHWCGSLKSELLVDDFLVNDSLEDLLSNAKLLCYFCPSYRLKKLLEDDDSKYRNLYLQLRKAEHYEWQFDENVVEKFASGEAAVIEESSMLLKGFLFKKLKEKKRKLYVGKTEYEQCYAHMFFNKRLPQDIKENIDYLATRITETSQLEPFNRISNFYKRGNVFEPGNSATAVSFTPINWVFLTNLFRVWIIGLSLATLIFCCEYFTTERWQKR